MGSIDGGEELDILARFFLLLYSMLEVLGSFNTSWLNIFDAWVAFAPWSLYENFHDKL